MKKSILGISGVEKLTKGQQKSIQGGIIPGGPCVSSMIVCTTTGNRGCPRGQGCYLEMDIPVAYCRCL